MKRAKIQTLRDEQRTVNAARQEEIRIALDAAVEEYGNRMLGKKKQESDSIKALSGGRPESNRRKF
jgi:hypothetical protein